MNSHFQSMPIAWTSSGLVPAGTGLPGAIRSSGRKGSSRWVLVQVTALSAMMMSSGQVQITSSSVVEWSKFGS